MIRQKVACDVYLNEDYTFLKESEDKFIDRLCLILIRAFNCDCHIIMSKIKNINIHVLGEMIEKSFYELNGLAEFKQNCFSVSISFEYFNLKLDELLLYYNYLYPENKIDCLKDL